MNDTPPKSRHGADNGASGTEDGLEQIRRLLLAPEQRGIHEIRRRLDDPEAHAQDVSRVLPSAVRLASARDAQMATAITPAVERALSESVRRNPRILTDTIFPVIGPAIRKAIAEAFAKLAQSLNQTLNHSLSAQGLKWRFEAYRTGKTFAEVVLAHTLIYRVEHVFLIHSKNGLLLQHVQAPNVTNRDPEMIAGMLTAIQDFTRDSFDTTAAEKLEGFDVGELHVWIENGSQASLAVVIRGNAPLELRTRMENVRDRIHAEQGSALAAFEGDTGPFEATRPVLEECLAQQVADEGAASGRPLLWVAVILGILLLAGIAAAVLKANHRHAQERDAAARQKREQLAAAKASALAREREDHAEAKWRDAVAHLRAEPGIVVTEAIREGDTYRVSGLRDPLAADPAAILAQGGIVQSRVNARWEPYFALHPALILRRARSRLDPPETVTLDLRDGVLLASGSASASWIEATARRAESIPGLERLDITGVTDETEKILSARAKAIEGMVISFPEGLSISPEDRGNVARTASLIEELRRTAAADGWALRITATGHTSPDGPERLNSSLAKSRADEAVRLLVESGAEPSIFTPLGLPSAHRGQASGTPGAVVQSSRNVTFRVTLLRGNATKNHP